MKNPSEIKGVFGTPGRIRTYDQQIRSLRLYPAELRALHPFPIAAGCNTGVSEGT